MDEHEQIESTNYPRTNPGPVRATDETIESNGSRYSLSGLIGRSPLMQELFLQIRKAAATDNPVLVTGEPGTGKEVAARLIQRLGPRSKHPIKCIDPACYENEASEHIFGCEKGTSPAHPDGINGALELTYGGTLLLDQVHLLPSTTQSMMLRALSDGHFVRNGGSRPIRCDCRIIMMTDASLNELRASGDLVASLLHHPRLEHIHLPALREHMKDLPIMISEFLMEFGREFNCRIEHVSERCLDALTAYQWPHNVRELRNVLRRAMLVSTKEKLTIDDLPERFRKQSGSGRPGVHR